jgi:8-amino-7-oxononanoate synthase
MKLSDDLGFDSLMMGDLAKGLAERFPGLPGIPQELLIDGPTVADLAAFVRTGQVAVDDHDDDAALAAFRPTWVASPWPALPGRPLPAGPALVTGPSPEIAATVARALAADGVDARPVGLDEAATREAGLIVWVGAERVPSLPQALAGAPWPDPAGELLAVLGAHARRGQRPAVVALSHGADLSAAGVGGGIRALAREWPDVAVKHLVGWDLPALVGTVRDELVSADRTAEVRWIRGRRHVPGLVRDDAAAAPFPGADEVVAITGGTRGIGLRLGLRLASLGASVVLVGRSAPTEEDAAAVAAFPNLAVARADVLDRGAVVAALAHRRVTTLIHAAGLLADGAVGAVDPEVGAAARAVKVQGLLHAVAACGPTLRRVHGLGSWAGRLGNRHQTHYAAANAGLAAVLEALPTALPGVVASCGEYGPWVGTAMADTIPVPMRAALRAEGVDFVGPSAGLDALTDDLGRSGAIVRGRRLPARLVRHEATFSLSPEGDPFLRDHAIEGHPVLPLAAVADRLAWAAALPVPYEITELKLYAGVVVEAPRTLRVVVDGERADLRGEDGTLHDRATVRALTEVPDLPPAPIGGDPPSLPLEAFYAGITFHGPLLRGVRSIDGVGDDFVRGTVVAGRPADWTPGTDREAYAVDPLALDSAFQLAAWVAWVRYRRAGTPVGIARLVVLGPLTPGAVHAADVHPREQHDDRFVADVFVRDAEGRPLLAAFGVVANLTAKDADAWTPDPVSTDPTLWPEVQDLEGRLEGVQALGLTNPYFHVHAGTARDTTVVDGRELVNFSSYNYLGYSGDPRVLDEVERAVRRYGTSVSASRVASGERPFHRELEAELAAAQGAEDSILFTAGHATNVTTIGHLFGPEDLVLHDAYIHDSAFQGIKLSGAARRWFRHEDPEHLAHELGKLRKHYRRCLVVVEGVYSMDGDLANLPAYVELKRRHGAMLMVDEAHSFGVVGASGRGIGEHHGLAPGDVDLWMGTLSKSLASCGGWIAGSRALVRYLRYTAPGFVYSAGLTAANGVAALTSLRLMLQEPERVARLQGNADRFHARCVALGLDNGPAKGGSGVVPVITGNSMHALVLSQRLGERGVNVQPIVYPAVPDDAARLRFFLSSTHTHDQLDHTADLVASTLAEVRAELPLP